MMRAKYKIIILYLCLSLAITLFLPAQTGRAQGQTSTETPSATESPAGNVDITETATPVGTEAGVSSTTPESNPESTRRILVKISSNARLINVMARMEAYGSITENSELAKLGVFIMDIPDGNFDEKLVELRNISGVGYVEPDYPVQAVDTIPNDPSFPSQYGLMAIRAPQGWDLSTGSPAVTIAILDSGVDLGHLELAGKIVQGYDFVNNDNIPQDDYGHGTHVAGIAAAWGNNGLGIAGVSWGARILPLKVLNSTGGGSFSNVAAALVWATDHGAQVVNMSLGGSSYSQIMQDAVTYASGNGVLMVAASGNAGVNFVLYPARFSEVIAVAATDGSNQYAAFSNYGAEIDVAAPGDNILSLWPGGYSTQSGTSMAAPFVSGLAAVLFGYSNNAATVRNQLETTALDVSPTGPDIYTGAGLIQMDAAIRQALSPTAQATQATSGGNPNPAGGQIQFFATATPTWTQTLLSTITTVVSVTLTFSVTPASTPSDLPAEAATQFATTTPELTAHGQELDFRSPYFYCGVILLLLGILTLILLARNRSSRRYPG
jgi:thermitase